MHYHCPLPLRTTMWVLGLHLLWDWLLGVCSWHLNILWFIEAMLWIYCYCGHMIKGSSDHILKEVLVLSELMNAHRKQLSWDELSTCGTHCTVLTQCVCVCVCVCVRVWLMVSLLFPYGLLVPCISYTCSSLSHVHCECMYLSLFIGLIEVHYYWCC